MQRKGLVRRRLDARRDATDLSDRRTRQSRCQAVIVAAGDQHEIRSMHPEPAPQSVRFGMIAVGGPGRRKFQQGRIGVCECNRKDSRRSDVRCVAQPLHRGAHGRDAGIGATQTADQNHCRSIRDPALRRERRFDARAAAGQADIERVRSVHRCSAEQGQADPARPASERPALAKSAPPSRGAKLVRDGHRAEGKP